MTPPPTDEFEKLRKLRDLVNTPEDWDEHVSMARFAIVAFAALGPEGCVTRELERLKYVDLELGAVTIHRDMCNERVKELQAERDAALAKHKLVSEAYADYRTTTDEVIARLERHAKDAQKENRVLLARLVKLSEAAQYAVGEWANGMIGRGMERVQAVLNEMPTPSDGPTREQALEHNSKLLCAQVNKLVARFIGDPSQGSMKILPPDLFDLAQMALDASKMWTP